MSKIYIYSTDVIALSVCVPKEMTRTEIEDVVNKVNPTGIKSL